MSTTRSKFCIAFALGLVSILGLANAVGVAIAAEPGKKTETRAVAPPMEQGADGWYDASPPDGSFKIRMPGVYSGFAEDGTTDSGAVTYTVGVRANLSAAFGVQTGYVASCIQQKGDKRNAKERLQSMIDRWDKLGTMRYRNHIDSASHPGFEFEMADDVKVLRARFYAPANRSCTLLLTWRPPAKPSDADIEKFFGSFEIAKR
jgi:hypothetical protein